MADQRRRADDRKPGVAPERGTTLTAGSFAGLGLQFALTILAFLYLGQWLDRKLGTAPWLLIAGVFIGAAGGFYSLYRALMASQKRGREPRER